MIEQSRYIEIIKVVCSIIGRNPSRDQLIAIYEKIKTFDLRDFEKTCDDDGFLSDAQKENISYPLLKRYILKHQMVRIEKEQEEDKKGLQNYADRFYRGNIPAQEKGKEVLKNIRLFMQGTIDRDEYCRRANNLGVESPELEEWHRKGPQARAKKRRRFVVDSTHRVDVETEEEVPI